MQVNSTIDALSRRLGRSPTPAEVAQGDRRSPASPCSRRMEASVAYEATSLDAPRASDSDGDSYADSIGADDDAYEQIEYLRDDRADDARAARARPPGAQAALRGRPDAVGDRRPDRRVADARLAADPPRARRACARSPTPPSPRSKSSGPVAWPCDAKRNCRPTALLAAARACCGGGTPDSPTTLERVGGLQAQYAPAMYDRAMDAARGVRARRGHPRARARRRSVQGTLMRATIHLVSAADYWTFDSGVARVDARRWLRNSRDTDTPSDRRRRAPGATAIAGRSMPRTGARGVWSGGPCSRASSSGPTCFACRRGDVGRSAAPTCYVRGGRPVCPAPDAHPPPPACRRTLGARLRSARSDRPRAPTSTSCHRARRPRPGRRRATRVRDLVGLLRALAADLKRSRRPRRGAARPGDARAGALPTGLRTRAAARASRGARESSPHGSHRPRIFTAMNSSGDRRPSWSTAGSAGSCAARATGASRSTRRTRLDRATRARSARRRTADGATRERAPSGRVGVAGERVCALGPRRRSRRPRGSKPAAR